MLDSSLQKVLRTYMLDFSPPNGLCMCCTVLYKMIQNGCIDAMLDRSPQNGLHVCMSVLCNMFFNLCMSCVSQMSLQYDIHFWRSKIYPTLTLAFFGNSIQKTYNILKTMEKSMPYKSMIRQIPQFFHRFVTKFTKIGRFSTFSFSFSSFSQFCSLKSLIVQRFPSSFSTFTPVFPRFSQFFH